MDQGNQIILNVTDFELESHPNCNYDYLEIRFNVIIWIPSLDLSIVEMGAIHRLL